jgi:DNA polymerase-3 subunit delta
MIIFLFGSDNFRLNLKFKEIIDHYQNLSKGNLQLIIFEDENLDFQEFKKFLELPSIFGDKRLIVLKNIFSNKEFKNNFFKEKEKILNSKNTLLISQEGKPEGKDLLFSFLIQNSKWQEFKKLEGEKLINWVKLRFKKYNLNISFEALNLFLEFTGNDTWQIEEEIKKLANFKKEGEVKIKDIEILIKPQLEIQTFKIIDALIEKKRALALKLINSYFKKGEPPLFLIGAIVSHFRFLISLRDLIDKNKPKTLILKELNPPFFLREKVWFQVQKFNMERLKKIYQKLFKIDFEIKTGKIDPQTALELLVAEI